jgi:peptidylprolyl isomerase
MADLKSVAVAEMAGGPLSLQEFLHGLKLYGQLSPLLDEAVRDRVLRQLAAREKVTVSDEELQAAVDRFRIGIGLSKAADTQQWLQDNRLTVDDLERIAEADLLREKLQEKITDERVTQHFGDNRTHYDQARVSHLVVDSAGAAEELLSQIRDDGANFADLARRHSLDEESGPGGGALGVLDRAGLGPAGAAAVFAARPGDVVGPFETDTGHHLILVEELLPAELNEDTSAAIRRELFNAWLEEEVRKANVQVKVYDYV